jgi:1-acyl-sn-glycerol-3-phosphate acyltransferase
MTLLLVTVVTYSVSILFWYIVIATIGASLVAVWQESKIWTSKGVPNLSLIGQIKVFLFNVCWMLGCLFGAICILIKYILSFGTSDISSDGNQIVEYIVAKLCVYFFVGHVTIIGIEHLPPINIIPAPIYIANHASQIDVGVVYYLKRRFKWISKQSVLYIPGVGLIMYLSKHIFIDRKKGKNEKSVSNLFEQSAIAVQQGIPMFFFPQGTRRMVERLPAKDGAFIVAQNNNSIVVCISIDIPTNTWNTLYPINQLWAGTIPTIQITIHPSIPSNSSSSSKSNDKEERERLKNQCMEIIYSVLPKYENEHDKVK